MQVMLATIVLPFRLLYKLKLQIRVLLSVTKFDTILDVNGNIWRFLILWLNFQLTLAKIYLPIG